MCICCRRRKAGSRRSRQANNSSVEQKVVPIDPIVGNLNDVTKLPEAKVVMKKPYINSQQSLKVASLSPGEALVMPDKGKGALKRIFLGIGWRSAKEETVDVDCTCAPYVKGIRVDEDTVWYRNLESRKYNDDKGKEFVSTKHTGDVLTGQATGGDLEDLERIYLDLESSPEDVDCFAFEANVFTSGLTFDDLDSAYIRMVNVDTNQEIMRCDINKSNLTNSRVILLAKLFRGKDRWVLHACVERRTQLLVQTPKGMIEKDMFLAKTNEVDPNEAPVAQEMDRGIRGQQELQFNQMKKLTTGKRAARPSNSYLMPAIAVGTAASVGAAILLFQYGSPISVGEMSAFSSGSYGVDFVNLVDIFTPTDCGCLSDFDVCGQNLGDSVGGAFDFVCQGGCCESLNIENPCACLECIGEPLKKGLGSVAECGGDCFAGVCDGVSGVTGAICGCPCEDMCDVVFVCDQCGLPNVGSLLDTCGSCVNGCPNDIGECISICSDGAEIVFLCLKCVGQLLVGILSFDFDD
eukprot:CAMPEP_0114343218 /NCGR_PEP_ID=MMETSP0101-20121206/10419_1 /TAXON_ID=38822 ORGANISM="Pteridomonas danica, Strain PT" /NCGR_SAMPLE_ID=MMETSP0101 /ASSEMBLY_ACC=CAM_ASM_000211 /LENGTH=520 /DNA_ID=CAMNT_0001477785 /DNA_START=131 /DNA_END=1694 /DNA_ORIENTATION=-